MPFTPYHFGPGLLFGVVLFPFLDFSTMIVASIILDFEPLIILALGTGQPLHGIMHTYLVATLVAMLVSAIIWLLRGPLYQFISLFGIDQEASKLRIAVSCLIGTNSHVLLDSFIYPEMNPFFPIMGNPFLGLISTAAIYQFCLICGIAGIIVYVLRFMIKRSNNE